MADLNEDGVWRTVGGRRIFIKKGQSLEEAMKESGKFPVRKYQSAKKSSDDDDESGEYDKLDMEQRVEEVMERTGFGENKSWVMADAVYRFTDTDYGEIRAGSERYQDLGKRIEDFIRGYKPPYDGMVYRGISVDGKVASRLLSRLVHEKNITMKGVSSWSSSRRIAERFARVSSEYNDGVVGMIFRVKNKKGVPIHKLSYYPEEREVLHSKRTKYKLGGNISIYQTGYYNRRVYVVDLEEVA